VVANARTWLKAEPTGSPVLRPARYLEVRYEAGDGRGSPGLQTLHSRGSLAQGTYHGPRGAYRRGARR
jgi:hypothetical protein